MNPNSVRAFIAIALDENLRLKIKDLQDKLKGTNTDIRWVKAENIHLTLQFIGQVPSEKIQNLCQAITLTTQGFSRFTFRLNQCGWFPQGSNPHILWVGIGDGSDFLQKIAHTLTLKILPFCEKTKVEKFSPHITIGRVRSDKNIDKLISRLKGLDIHFHEAQKVSSLVLFQSQLTPSGQQ